jgi:hypothetical protein
MSPDSCTLDRRGFRGSTFKRRTLQYEDCPSKRYEGKTAGATTTAREIADPIEVVASKDPMWSGFLSLRIREYDHISGSLGATAFKCLARCRLHLNSSSPKHNLWTVVNGGKARIDNGRKAIRELIKRYSK